MARVGMPRKFVFVCVNKRPDEHPRPSCAPRGSAGVFEAIREETGKLGLVDIKIVASGCLEPCMVGPAVYVAPDDHQSATAHRNEEQIELTNLFKQLPGGRALASDNMVVIIRVN